MVIFLSVVLLLPNTSQKYPFIIPQCLNSYSLSFIRDTLLAFSFPLIHPTDCQPLLLFYLTNKWHPYHLPKMLNCIQKLKSSIESKDECSPVIEGLLQVYPNHHSQVKEETRGELPLPKHIPFLHPYLKASLSFIVAWPPSLFYCPFIKVQFKYHLCDTPLTSQKAVLLHSLQPHGILTTQLPLH